VVRIRSQFQSAEAERGAAAVARAWVEDRRSRHGYGGTPSSREGASGRQVCCRSRRALRSLLRRESCFEMAAMCCTESFPSKVAPLVNLMKVLDFTVLGAESSVPETRFQVLDHTVLGAGYVHTSVASLLHDG
jgi:hypothetical protein